MVGPPDNVDESEEYLQDDGEIDYSKVPDIDLPPPLPSSKFAQNPELLKTLNRGGKRKFDQLIGWSDGGASDRTSKIHQPVFGGIPITEDSQSSDTDLRFGKPNAAETNSFQDEDHRRSGPHGDSRSSSRGDEDLRFGRPNSRNEYELSRGNSFADKDFRNIGFPSKKLLDMDDMYDERDRDGGRWTDDEKGIGDGPRKPDGTYGSFGDKRDNGMATLGPGSIGNSIHGHMAGMPHLQANHHNMQNINPNMPPPIPSLVPHPGMAQHPGMQGKPPHPGLDGPIPPHMMPHHPSMHHPGFGPNGPPPGGFGPNFRPPPNGNFGPNHFRPSPMPPFGPNHQGPPPPFGNNFQGPPNAFRGPNAGPMNFDRPSFGPNFRGQNPQAQLNNFNSNFGNFGKNGPNRGMNRGGDNMGRNNYNNRGRGRDNDQSRAGRGRDNY